VTDSLAKARRDLWRASKKYRRLHGMVGRTVWAADSRWLAHRSIVGEPAAGLGETMGRKGIVEVLTSFTAEASARPWAWERSGAYVLVGQPNWPSKPERGVSDCSTVRCWFDGDTFEALRRCVVLAAVDQPRSMRLDPWRGAVSWWHPRGYPVAVLLGLRVPVEVKVLP